MSTNQPINTGPTTTTLSQGISGVRIRSPLGLLAALAFLVGIPISFGWQILFGSGAGTMIHFVLAAGSVLLAFAVFDFKLPRWMNWIGCAAGVAVGSIFLLQAVALLIPNESLNYFAYEVLGQWPEGWLPDVIILWFVALLVFDSQGKSRILGIVAVSIAVCSELYSHILRFGGTSDTGSLKLLMLLPFVWLLFESTKKPHPKKPQLK
jgi:hypothetical protein